MDGTVSDLALFLVITFLAAAVFQPAGLAIFAMSALWIGVNGSLSADTLRLVVLGLPVLLMGTWLGLRQWTSRRDALSQARPHAVAASGVSLVF
jgi:uncharacterized protein